MNYDWKKDEIINSNTSEHVKEVLLNEMNNTDANIPEWLYMPTSYKDFKRVYKSEKRNLKWFSKNLLNISENAHKLITPDDIVEFKFPDSNLSIDDLISYLDEFIDYLEDNDIKKVYEIIKTGNYLRITDSDNDVYNYVEGRCIKDIRNNKAYLSYKLKNKPDDLFIIAHELGHTLSAFMFGSDINLNMFNFFSEVESYYFESLMARFIGEKYDPSLSLALLSNRLSKIVEIIYTMNYQDLLYKYKYNFDKLNSEFMPNISITKDNYLTYLRIIYSYASSLLHSCLIASNLYIKTVKDKEYGIYRFKELMKSENTNPDYMLSSNDLDTSESIESFKLLYKQAKEYINLQK